MSFFKRPKFALGTVIGGLIVGAAAGFRSSRRTPESITSPDQEG